ncbi:arginase [Leucothrix arctica]|uniref:Arginase n=1 Tax=Leucothrix arctica TaxID=1481894 RepID=A0A317CP60_9GAMM|nr:arginase [Leucothrix arctica]PWQ98122.1 arginase [Leucothrix arctica]
MSNKHNTVQIIGVPLDLGASRRGTDAGPMALRVAGLRAALRKMDREVAVDIDIAVPQKETQMRNKDSECSAHFKDEILAVCTDLANATYQALENDYFPLITGGDHSVAMGSVSATSHFYRQQQQEIGLLWFDAHGDMNTPQSSPSGNIHGMPLAHLLGNGDRDLVDILAQGSKVKPENVVLIGVRDIDKNEQLIIRDAGIHVFTMRDIDERGMAAVSREAIELVTKNTAGFHLSFDLDGCDPSVIPGTGTAVLGGVNYREAHLFMELCAESQGMLAMDVVELNPFLDQKNVSAERAVLLIQSALGQSIL